MLVYVVCTRLSGENSGADYSQLGSLLKSLGSWSDRLGSSWIIETSLGPKQIRDLAKPHLFPGDRLFVAEIGEKWAATGLGAGFAEWMSRRGFQ